MAATPRSHRHWWLAALTLVVASSDAPTARQTCSSPPILRLGGTTPEQASRAPAVSADGRFVAFHSGAADLDGDSTTDVFVYDRVSCALEVVSRSSTGVKGNGTSELPSMSADGRFVAFQSSATNLSPLDTNGSTDIFVRDRQLAVTILASVSSSGTQAASGATDAAISGNGAVVAFISSGTTLVPDDVNLEADVFVRDLVGGTTELASISSAGAQGDSSSCCGVAVPVLSWDGRIVAFRSHMNNLVLDDFNNSPDIFVRDRQAGTTVRASLTSTGGELSTPAWTAAVTADGRFVFFEASQNFVPGNNTCDGIFIRDLELNTTSCPALDPLSQKFAHLAGDPKVSADGRFVAFTSTVGYYSPGTNGGVYVHDRTTGATRCASNTLFGAIAGGGGAIQVSADGQWVVFESGATNLAPGDTNNATDVFEALWSSLSSAPHADVIRNGAFSSGLTGWQTFATPDQSHIVTDATGGLLQFYRVPPAPGTTNQAVVFQNTWAQLLPHAPVEARFRAGNSSTVRKRLSVLVHDGDFSDLSVCVFWLAPGAPLRDYVMRAHTTEFWSNATISFYAATAGSDGGFYQIDGVSLSYRPLQDDDLVDCVDPTAPAAPGGAPGPTMIANGDFASGLGPWTTFGQITWQIAGEVFEFLRPPGTPAGVVFQPTGQAVAQDAILTAAFYLGNSSGARKRVTVLLHDGDFSDLTACTFWLPPGLPLSPYYMRTFASEAWTDGALSVYPATVGDDAWIRIDDVILQRTPGAAPLGTECIEPGADQLVLLARGVAVTSAGATGRTAAVSATGRAASVGPGPWTSLDLRRAAGDARRLVLHIASRAVAATLEISLDGVNWTPLATVPASDDELTIELDLSSWLGASVHLRFVEGSIR